MNVLHFYKTYYPDSFGGVEQFIFELSKGLSKNGVVSNVLSLSSKIETNFENTGNGIYKVKTNFKIASTDFSFRVIKEFKKLANEADLIHYHFPWPFMDVVHFSSNHKKPTIVTYHSDIIKQKNLLRLYKPLMNRFLKDIDLITVSSPNYLKSSENLQNYKNKVEVIPFGISNERVDRDHEKLNYWKEQLGDKFFFFVGVHRYYKGLNYLIEALAVRDIPTVIAGEGPMTSELKALAKKLNLKNIKFIGEVSDEDKDAIFQMSYAFIFPSHLRSESFGISLLEAAMYGKPMISCEISTGTSFINLNHETGLVIPAENPNAIHKAMEFLWDNPQVADEMGRAAKERYFKQFTSEQMCKSYLDLYNKILSK